MAARWLAESAATIGMVGKTQRSDSMVSMPSPAAMHVARHAEADRIAEKIAHRPSWRIDRCLAEPLRSSRRVEPGAVHPGDRAVEIGDGGDHRRPGSRAENLSSGR